VADTRTTRRGFLAAGAATAAGLAVPRTRVAAQTEAPRDANRPRNIILLVSDGCSHGTIALCDLYRWMTEGRGSEWLALSRREGAVRALVDTASADSHVTDSAAAASAWGIGRRVDNLVVNITPEGAAPEPLCVRASAAGFATGLVTTTRITHATPAGFIANVRHRDLEEEIAGQMLGRGVDVALGGGAKHFAPDLLAAHESSTRIVRTRDELFGPGDGRRVLGLFSRDHVPYVLDRGEAQPTLPEMTAAAIERLAADGRPFFLMVEGGRVDHAAHDNDAGSLMHEQVEFDRVVRMAADFTDRSGDTLLLVTTDHGNANPALGVMGPGGNAMFEHITGANRSLERLAGDLWRLRADASPEDVRELVQSATGVALANDEVSTLRRWRGGEPVDPYKNANLELGPLASLLANHHGVAFLCPFHTSDPAELTAFGPGAEAFAGAAHHTDVHDAMAALLGLAPA